MLAYSHLGFSLMTIYCVTYGVAMLKHGISL